MAKREVQAKMPISKPFPSHSSEGFTLIEMLVVLAILSLAAVLFVSSTSGKGALERKQSIVKLEQRIQTARRLAIEQGTARSVNLDAETAQFSPVIGSDKYLMFYADGSSNGGELHLTDGKKITIRWIDGATVQ